VKILLFGKTGQLGWELRRALAVLGDVVAPGREDVDLENLDDVRAAVRSAAPDIIVNAAAYTAVDQAETDRQRAERVNSEAVDLMAREAARGGAWLVHYSTDYVFDGTGTRPYREDDAPNPLSAYGRTKLEGENALRAHHDRHLIFRTSWLFGTHGSNFAKTILRLAGERDELAVVADQTGVPTSAELVAAISTLALRQACSQGGEKLAGTYHVAAGGETTWYEYARYVVARARDHGVMLKATADRIRPIATKDYPLPAARPSNSRLDTSKVKTTFGLRLPDWHGDVAQMVAKTFERA
jgi:dTDP-4-dehydrorhamnose reductase